MQSERGPVDGDIGGGGLKTKLASRLKKRSEDSPEKRKQLQDYTAWVNNYLRRKPGTTLISDLRWSLGDGVTFVHLVEIVAKVQVSGVERWPSSVEGQRLNTERALEFLEADGVSLHLEACRDLMEGNVKGVMKVILAIAERYQPKSVKPRSEPVRPSNHTAPVSIPDIHYTRVELPRPHTQPQPTTRMDHSVSQPLLPLFHHPSPYPSPYPQEEMYSSPIDQLPANKPPQMISSKKKLVVGGRGRSGMYGIPEDSLEEWEGPVGVARVDDKVGLAGEIGAVVSGLTDFKTELLQLHAVLLRNNDGVRDVGGASGEGEGREGREAREKEMMNEMRERLGHMQDEYTQVEAECSALRNMVEERNAFITTIKSEIYRKEYLNDTQQAELHTQLLQKETHIKRLETDLASCHGNLESRENELATLQGDLEQSQETVERNRAELDQLRSEVERVRGSEEKTAQRLLAKEKKLLSCEEKLAEERERSSRRVQQMSEDLESLAEGLAGVSADSAQQEEVECLVKLVSEMGSRLDQPLPVLPSSPARRRRGRDTDDHSRHRRKRRGERQAAEPHPLTTPSSPNMTRVLYHMAGESRNEVPFVAIVHKKASEVTLKDFKDVFGRHGNYRFFFKTEDPDCGVVKEEVTLDDQILPHFRGKVTAWIQEMDTSVPIATPQ